MNDTPAAPKISTTKLLRSQVAYSYDSIIVSCGSSIKQLCLQQETFSPRGGCSCSATATKRHSSGAVRPAEASTCSMSNTVVAMTHDLCVSSFDIASCRKGNEHFKAKEFPAAIQCYNQAIAIDGANHVLFGNRRSARIPLPRESSTPTALYC